MPSQIEKLRNQIEGEVRDDTFSKLHYSVDASIFQIEPVGVVIPRTAADVEAAIAFARQEGIPIIPRGAATGIAGGCIGRGLVIDFAQFQNKILDINYDEEYAVVEAGVVQDQLNQALAGEGFRFGPDTSTGNRATIGGMLGNNSSGAHSMRYGKTIENILACEFLLSSGETLQLGTMTAAELQETAGQDSALGRICAALVKIRSELADEIHKRYPKISRRVSGYSLDEMLGDQVNLAQLVCGSEGTLGIATQMKVKISRSPKTTGVSVVHFEDLIEGLNRIPFMLGHEPFAVELMDDKIMAMGKQSPAMRGKLDWLDGNPEGLLVVEFDGESEVEVADKLEKFEAACKRDKVGYSQVRLTTPAEIGNVWQLRKAGLGLLLSRRSDEKAIAFLEDSAVPPERVGEFMGELRTYIRKIGKEAGFYGHAGVGLIHLRPMLDLRKQDDLDAMVKMMEDVTDMLLGYGGSLSGEHGDGLVRSWLIEKMYGPKIYQAFRDLKAAFDPKGLMNPGKILDGPRPVTDLRVDPDTKDRPIETAFTFEGGLPMSAGMCNGNAECRKKDGLMCPSFHVTNDELHSTRARATSIQGIMYGRLPAKDLTSESMYKTMEYCLQCKGCKVDCPSVVDVAKMKSEFLYQYQKTHGVPLRSRIFGNIDKISQLASPFAPIANFFMETSLSKAVMDKVVGITSKRKAPPFARERFSKWLKKRGGPKSGDGDKIALFVGTFTEFNYPEIGQAAIKLLEALGCKVRVEEYACCGRPAISKGLLDSAKGKAKKIQDLYGPIVDQGYRILGLEPSCILTFRDEHPSLVPGPVADKLAKVALTFDEYLDELLQANRLDLSWNDSTTKVLLHGHCHQKAQVGTNPTLNVLKSIPGFDVSEIPSGCCGMAGTFGYESEHYDFSMRVGELQLFPAIRASDPDTIFVASGLSCRSQIEHGTQREGKHIVQVLADRLS